GWTGDLTSLGDGRQVGFRYFGVGDVGGAPDLESMEWLKKARSRTGSPLEIRNTSPDQLAKDLSPEQRAALPEYEGELTMKTHGVGCYTSQAAMKRFNRENELLADAAERAAVTAEWLTGLSYPGERLREAWTRVLWHQFHDDLTGTCIPQAYQFSWNDELISANQFAAVLSASAEAVSQELDTQGPGVSLVVYNPLSASRRDTVEATVELSAEAPTAVRVVDRDSGRDTPAQVLGAGGRRGRVLFLAERPAGGYKVFGVLPAAKAGSASSVTVTRSSEGQLLENSRYKVAIDARGDIASVVDKEAGRELLQ